MATDNFTNSNNTKLTTHNANWSFITEDGVDEGRIYNNGVSISVWSVGAYRRTDSTADSSEIVLLGGETGAESKIRPIVRASSSSTGYGFNLQDSGGSTWTVLNLYKNASWQQEATGLSYDKAINHTLRITASGTSPVTITCYIDGSSILTWEDSSSPIASGNPGIFLVGNGGNNYAFGDDWTDGVSAATALPHRALSGPFYGSLRGSVQ